MILRTLGKLAAMLLLGGALAGCIDADVDVVVTGEGTAKATLTQTMGAEFYSMIKMDAEQSAKEEGRGEDEFCADGELTENADGTATCSIVEEGAFADIRMGNDGPSIVFAAAGPGLVRISLPTAAMKAEIGADESLDEETQKMVEAFFAGHSIMLRFSGAEVTETNMTISADKTAAETKIAFLDLINGDLELPDELFAIVRVP